MRTKALFQDLPFHIEYDIGRLPIIPIGFIVEFDLSIKDRNNPDKYHKIDGSWRVKNVKNVYDSGDGIIQYLEFQKE